VRRRQSALPSRISAACPAIGAAARSCCICAACCCAASIASELLVGTQRLRRDIVGFGNHFYSLIRIDAAQYGHIARRLRYRQDRLNRSQDAAASSARISLASGAGTLRQHLTTTHDVVHELRRRRGGKVPDRDGRSSSRSMIGPRNSDCWRPIVGPSRAPFSRARCNTSVAVITRGVLDKYLEQRHKERVVHRLAGF
jgi:hypothetical protein